MHLGSPWETRSGGLTLRTDSCMRMDSPGGKRGHLIFSIKGTNGLRDKNCIIFVELGFFIDMGRTYKKKMNNFKYIFLCLELEQVWGAVTIHGVYPV